MKVGYKVILISSGFYKEYAIPEEKNTLRLGTVEGCDLSIPKSGCSFPFSIELQMQQIKCSAACSEGVCFSDGEHEASFCVMDKIAPMSEETGERLFTMQVAIAFEKKRQLFDLGVELPQGVPVTIGGTEECTIRITDYTVGRDSITLRRDGSSYYLWTAQSKYGVYVNGRLSVNSREVRNYSFVSLDGFQLYIRNGYLYVEDAAEIRCPEGWGTVDGSYSKSHLEYPKFNKSTRFLTTPSDEKIEVLDPPDKPEQKKPNIILQLLPSIIMLVLIIALRGVMGGGGYYIIFSACTMGIGVCTSVASIITGKKDAKKADETRTAQYEEYISRKREEISAARETEKTQLEEIYRSPERDIQAVKDFSPELFDRSPEDYDFLKVYIGTGDQPARRGVICRKRETIQLGDELSMLPSRLCGEYLYIHDVPICSDFRNSNVIGVVGEDQKLYGMMKNMTLDLCTRHFYKDIKLFYVINTDFSNYIMWLRWLPHVRNDELGIRNIVCSNESKTTLFEYLYSIMAAREQTKGPYTHIIVFILSDMDVKSHPLSRYLDKSSSLGVTFVFFVNYAELLPDCCDELITLSDSSLTGELVRRNGSGASGHFAYHMMDDETAMQVALRLSPIYCEEIRLEGNLPQSYSFFDCFDIWAAADLNIGGRWESANVADSLAAPIGINAKKELVYLDIHEKEHGPHGLVAGTTGSGKSELLLSYILSMSICYPPNEVAFLIIDFKGGGLANQLRGLPHLTGTITNIDGREITRSLKSIKAELKKRQRLFAESNVNKIDDYIMLYKKGIVSVPLPHLIVVVDEFAELKADQPEFMKELISASRIGRSLGIHLILATQKPSGQVNDQIWSNSRFHLCLKVQSREDSNEMLKSPLAAEIREPGRAYFQVGNDEIFELFQSAYSGSPANAEAIGKQEAFQIAEVSLWGKRNVVYEKKPSSKGSAESETQLQSVVAQLAAYCRDNGIKPLPGIYLDPLPETLSFVHSQTAAGNLGIGTSIGVFDDPDNQRQAETFINVSTENTLIIGSAQFGKTNLLQTIIRGVAERYSPRQVNIYIADFGSRVLKTFEPLCHVGGVVCAAEDEKLKNLLKLLLSELETRKDALLEAGVSSYTSYLDAGFTALPQIVLVIDNLTAFNEACPQDDNSLLRICREGLAVGISVIATNGQSSGVNSRFLANFARRICLYCHNSDEYSALFGFCRMRPDEIPGRCLIEEEKRVYEAQAYLAFEGEREIERTAQVKRFIEAERDMYPKTAVRGIPSIPETLTKQYITDNFKVDDASAFNLALDYASIECVPMPFSGQFMLALKGRDETRKAAFLASLLEDVKKNIFIRPVELYFIDSVRRSFRFLNDQPYTERYTVDTQEIPDIVESVRNKLSRRYERAMEDGGGIGTSPLLLVVVNNRQAIDVLSESKSHTAMFSEIMKRYRQWGVMFIFSDLDEASAGFSAPEILKRIKEEQKAIIFGDLKNEKLFDISATAARKVGALTKDDAYLLRGGDICRVRLIQEV